ncbi:MAG: M20 family metallopeptidase [Chloroflexi bacterium]|nr:M20 family metallopeptidase [Chloroflexota bacterium]
MEIADRFDFLAHYADQKGSMVWTLSGLIESETPTADKAAIDELGDWLSIWAKGLDASSVTIHEQKSVGNFVECRWNQDLPGKPILICCHMDTVHPKGSVEKRPTRTEGDILYGVGAYDMKGGITLVQTVLQDLFYQKGLLERPITVLFTSDEEIGSLYSREVIERLALESGLVLVMEPATDPETIVTERKGVGIFQMVALGRESHSGSNPEEGVNAIVEMASQIGRITALSDLKLGTTVNPTVIHGGTTHNVIPGECDITINARVRYKTEVDRVTKALSELSRHPTLPNALLFTTGGFIRPPMEHTSISEETFATLQKISPIPLKEIAKGGGSDGNFTAALGVPTIDGLGPSGGGAHSDDEHVYIPSLPQRAALLASILCYWPDMR